MFPLWDVAIKPLLHAIGARRVVEIGALRGETTEKMLADLGPECELHVVDPVPDFDPSDHEKRFAGRYVFHEALSLDVLPTLGPVDAALIDGDHNWYTVVNELRMLGETAKRSGTPLPLCVLHDVLWPYGRRDLYYAPEQIPPEHRQPYAYKGIRPGQSRLAEAAGLNRTMANATAEGGDRNGVMTAVDDFVAEWPEPLRVIVLPIYFGLAIVVDEARLAREPALADAIARLESAEGRHDLLEVAERVRLRAMVFQHDVVFVRRRETDRARSRYLRTVKAALGNEHYLDHEVRFEQLSAHVTEKRTIVANEIRDPARNDQIAYRRVVRNRTGPAGPETGGAESFVPYTAMGRPQLDAIEAALDAIRDDGVPGDLVECGTGRGGGGIFLRAYLDAYEIDDRDVYVADRFRAAPDGDDAPAFPGRGVAGFRADLNLVRDGFERFELLDDRVRFLQGPLHATIPGSPIDDVALLRIGRGLGAEARGALDLLYDRIPPGGAVVVDGEPTMASRRAADEFRAARGITTPLEAVGGSAVTWRKTASEGTAASAPKPALAEQAAGRAGPPLAPSAPTDTVDLTVVVVFYDMKREAARTLHSLSRAYQEQLGDATYEVIAVENGSHADQVLGREFVESFGPEFRYLDLGAEGTAEPSPVGALNRGIREGRGENYALMIDGAHVLTPGVLHFGLAGLATYAPAIVATQQWYLGPGQQGDVMDDGYDQAYEDRLFEAIRWPSAGHRLFEIGHFVGDRDWLDGVWESNCMFVPRAQLEQVGCFDESFSVAGGGYANLELYERLGSSPDVTVATIMGEGSFHQVHGGTTTNQIDAAERRSRVFGYSEQYAELRGRPFKGPGKPLHFVGRIPNNAARRSKPRRMSAQAFAEGAAAGIHDGRPDEPIPLPDELRWSFTEAAWRAMPWRSTTWLGVPTTTAPTDLVAYQELVAAVRPDWIVDVGTGDGSRALFLASMCELVGHGAVLTVSDTDDPAGDVPQHPRLHHLGGIATADATVAEVRERVGDGRALVFLGACADRATTAAQFEAYSPLVPVGSSVVVTETIVNGHPVWPAFGPGPAEGVKQILTRHGEFVADPLMEKYALTFNPGGYLRRVK